MLSSQRAWKLGMMLPRRVTEYIVRYSQGSSTGSPGYSPIIVTGNKVGNNNKTTQSTQLWRLSDGFAMVGEPRRQLWHGYPAPGII